MTYFLVGIICFVVGLVLGLLFGGSPPEMTEWWRGGP